MGRKQVRTPRTSLVGTPKRRVSFGKNPEEAEKVEVLTLQDRDLSDMEHGEPETEEEPMHRPASPRVNIRRWGLKEFCVPPGSESWNPYRETTSGRCHSRENRRRIMGR